MRDLDVHSGVVIEEYEDPTEIAMFKIVGLLSWRMFPSAQTQSGDLQGSISAGYYLNVLESIAFIAQAQDTSEVDRLRAHMCLAIVHRSFIERCAGARSQMDFPMMIEEDLRDLFYIPHQNFRHSPERSNKPGYPFCPDVVTSVGAAGTFGDCGVTGN
ncbi:hypothetical protein PENSPDRAFT_257496 [Peniophora sp. CONT]|nr:hypothetical protein PENSPDRAFT_257496 [Peniophora sp. CONT]